MAIKNLAVIRESDDFIENIIVWDDTDIEPDYGDRRLLDVTSTPNIHLGGTLTVGLDYTPPTPSEEL